MKTTTVVRTVRSALTAAVLLGVTASLGPRAAQAQEKQPFTVSGSYVEGCSCSGPCPCELTGVAHGCSGVGGVSIATGSYMGTDLAGAKIAYATAPGDWVRVYVDAANPAQREAATAFAKAVFGPFGKIEEVKPAKIDLSGSEGHDTLSVDNGNIMQLTTEPVLGGDNRTPIAIHNIKDPLHPTVMQGKTITGSYHDGDHSFTLKDSNSYFNDHVKSKGKI
jgi:hypothetical protein